MTYLTVITILLFGTLPAGSNGACCDCPTFWTAFGNNCYRYFGQRVNLNQARQNCRLHGNGGKMAYLVSVHSQQEQDYLDALAKSYIDDSRGNDWHVWIGLNDEKEEGSFVWTDDSQVDFTSWSPGEPQGATREQGVVMGYRTSDSDGLWRDTSTAAQFTYICKMPRCI